MNKQILVRKSITFEIVSADIVNVLDSFYKHHIPLKNISRINDLTIRIDVLDKYIEAVESLLYKRGERYSIYRKSGLLWQIQGLVHRPILVAGILILLLFSVFLPTRILFIEVRGNEQIPTQSIIECAELCGIRFGASRASVRSEKLKNALLEIMPQLQWAAVNTNGCVAVISVQERIDPKVNVALNRVCNIVADRDGVITECTITKGTPMCKVGQAIQSGDILVSGYNDFGLHTQLLHAEAEIFAQTKRTLTCVYPLDRSQKQNVLAVERKYSLIFGKKKINLYKDSGISGATCDKIYTNYPLMLPGGFSLPITVCVEVWTYYELNVNAEYTTDVFNEISAFSNMYTLSQMVAGTILDHHTNMHTTEQLVTLTKEMTCHEMIGRVKYEENLLNNGKDN